MEYKQAIEFLEEFLEYARKNRDIPIYDRYIQNGTFLKNDAESLKQIISLLQQGEKYRQMWEELEETDMNIDSPIVNDTMYYIKQKYFPKEAKQDEADNK